MRRRDIGGGLSVMLLASLLAGCGGTGGGSGGRIAVGVLFPPRAADRAATVPSNAESIRVSVLRPAPPGSPDPWGSPLVPDTIINRPPSAGTAQATINDIPPGPAVVRAVAYPQPQGLGPALAEASTAVTIKAGRTTTVSLSLAAIVDRVVASPASMTLLVGEKTRIEAHALDATGAIIIGAPLTYTSGNKSVATVADDGWVTAAGLGSTTITVKHEASGKSAEVKVQVVRTRIVRVEVAVDRPATVVGQSVKFTATAYNDLGQPSPGAQFDWRLADASAMGTITNDGVFTPAEAGTGRVIATERSSGVAGMGLVIVEAWVVLVQWPPAITPTAVGGHDLDLHLFDPAGRQAYWGHRSIPVGDLVMDSIREPGLEAFAGRLLTPGRYPLAVNYFRGQGSVAGEATLLAPDKTPATMVFTLTEANANRGYPVTTPTASWARPFDVVISSTGEVSAEPADTSIPLGGG